MNSAMNDKQGSKDDEIDDRQRGPERVDPPVTCIPIETSENIAASTQNTTPPEENGDISVNSPISSNVTPQSLIPRMQVPGAFAVPGPGIDEVVPEETQNENHYPQLERVEDGVSIPDATPDVYVVAHLVDPEEDNQSLIAQLRRARRERDRAERQLANAPLAQLSLHADPPTPAKKKRKRRIIGGVSLVSVGLLAVVIALGVIRPWLSPSEVPTIPGATTEPPSIAPTAPAPTPQPTAPAPTPQPTAPVPLVELLSSVSSDGGDALRTPLTPQIEAYEWIRTDMKGSNYSHQKIIQRYALATFYHSTQGDPSWDRSEDWLTETDECDWEFVNCNARAGVETLNVEQNSLVGSIPPEIGLLFDSLVVLNLYDNSIYDIIPSEVGLLTALTSLDLSYNFLTGRIPSETTGLKGLVQLYLSKNLLTGGIPSEISSLTALRRLRLYKNALKGKIPTELFDLSSLEVLELSFNRLTGTISTEIAKLNKLTELWVQSNKLSGNIPSELGELLNLEALFLHDLLLEGSIPTELGNFEALKFLYLQGSKLSGPIPTEFGRLPNVEHLFLDNNQLNGSIPSELTKSKTLAKLSLGNCSFTGSIPSNIVEMTNLTHFSAQFNMLTGSIPANVAEMKKLYRLVLYGNRFTGNFTCPNFIDDCQISCNSTTDDACRSL